MKLANIKGHGRDVAQSVLHLPYGLIGFPEMRQFEVDPVPESWPLLSMKSAESEELQFYIVEPETLIAGYELEIGDDDLELLRIKSADDVQLYNIVTIHSLKPQYVTVNLVGPIVINRHTLIGKQVIIVNFEKYSSQHVLIDERQK
jgi:flagellar assembly factor FliW